MFEAFFVVCADGHGGYGPFTDRETAGEWATQANARKKCVYRVVPIAINPDAMKAVIDSKLAGLTKRPN